MGKLTHSRIIGKKVFTFSNPSTYFAFDRSGIYSEGDFEATRRGDRLFIRGTVTNRLGRKLDETNDKETEAFDFNPLQPGHREGRALEGVGDAKPFDMDYRRQQNVEAELLYEPDGDLTLLRSTWGPEE